MSKDFFALLDLLVAPQGCANIVGCCWSEMFRSVAAAPGEDTWHDQRYDSLQTLLMTNLPRIASLESWKRDVVHDMNSLSDWKKTQKTTTAAYGHRIRQIERRLGMPPPPLESAGATRPTAPERTAEENPFSMPSHTGPGTVAAPSTETKGLFDFDFIERHEMHTQTGKSLTLPAVQPTEATSVVISADHHAPLHTDAAPKGDAQHGSDEQNTNPQYLMRLVTSLHHRILELEDSKPHQDSLPQTTWCQCARACN